MTNTYKTLNPLGSTSAKDLSDNASNFDEGMNSASPAFYDRLNKRRETWAGMEKQVNDFLEAMGFEATHLQYVDGTPLTVLRPTQLIDRAPSVYKVKAPATFPVSLTGTWATDQLLLVDVGDASLRASLAAEGGVSLVTGAVQRIRTYADLLALPAPSADTVAETLGYHDQGDGGHAKYYWDGFAWVLMLDGGQANIKQFGAIAGVFDAPTQAINDAAFQAARDWVASGAVRNHLVFPAGVYAYTVSPNWAIQNARITTTGEVRLRYFGTGNAVIIDLGPTISTYLFNVTMGPFLVEAPSTAQHGVYVRSIHHSRLIFKVRGAGTNYAGIKVDFAVCTDFSESSCYPNDDGNWYLTSKPKYGLHLDKRNAGEQVSYCLFNNTIWEGLDQAAGAGILLEGTLGNIFNGGTSERCNHGVISTFNAINNRFYGTDFEANIARDILDDSQGNEYHGVDSAVLVTVGSTALFPKFFGGTYFNVEIAIGARYPLFSGISIARFPGGGFSNGEPTSMFRDCINMQTQTIQPLTQGAITVGASPFTYTNATGNDQTVMVAGGTVSTLTFNRNAVDEGLPGVAGTFHLSPGDAIRVAYTVVPNMYLWSK